jgi:hypothetical protein
MQIGASRVKPSTMRGLAVIYYASMAFKSMKPSSQSGYRSLIDKLCRETDKDGRPYGDKSVVTLQRARRQADGRAPWSSQRSTQRLRVMMQHAVEIGLRADDPTRDVRAIRVKSDGFQQMTRLRNSSPGIRSGQNRDWRSRSSSTLGSGARTWCGWRRSISAAAC